MTDEPTPEERERIQRNLNAVARQMQEETPPKAALASPSLKKWGPIGAAVVFALTKFKWILAALKFAKFGTLISMLISVWAYGLLFGLPFAVGFVMLIFVHEMGHALAMRRMGIPAGAPVFIPFVGAVIAMKGMPRNAWVEAIVGIGGPLLGTLGAAACLAVAAITQSPFWFALASTGFLINLFNMIPISPLDGGRVVGVISRWLWLVGYAVGITVFLLTYSPILFLILLVGLFRIPQLIKPPQEGYYDLPASKRIAMGAIYFGSLAVMTLGMWVSDQALLGMADMQAAIDGAAAVYALGHVLQRSRA